MTPQSDKLDPTPCYGFIQDYHKILLSEEKPPPKIFSFPQNVLWNLFEDITALLGLLEKGCNKGALMQIWKSVAIFVFIWK